MSDRLTLSQPKGGVVEAQSKNSSGPGTVAGDMIRIHNQPSVLADAEDNDDDDADVTRSLAYSWEPAQCCFAGRPGRSAGG